ncbi:prepilin peptidase [Erysipelothrix aquatica]|uniref:prepilin peptidase n=1 Tax=Erysipelothrix aquatica TaxID=2683714 RepID=UPI001356A7B6|nr:prepilin peptidase [Erysipelothrix aquatica]
MKSVLTSIFCLFLTFLVWCWGFHIIHAINNRFQVQRHFSVFIFMAFNLFLIFRRLMEMDIPWFVWIAHGLFIVVLVLMSLIDTYTYCILNQHLLICFVISLLHRVINPLSQNHFIFLTCVVPLLLIVLKNNKYMGFGDVILLLICALYLNLVSFYITLVIAVMSATGCSILLIAMRRRSMRDTIPFVPFITFGFVMTLLFDAPIWFGFQ